MKTMSMKIVIFCSLFIFIFLMGCAPSQPAEQAVTVVEKQETPAVPNDDTNGPPVIVTVEQGGLVYKQEILLLLEKSKKVQSYKYYFDTFRGGKYYEVFIHNGMIRKVYNDVLKFKQDLYYNEVYFSPVKKEAIAVCTQGGVLCTSIWNKAFFVHYDIERVPFTPRDLLFNLSYDAHKVGEEIFDNRKTTIIEFTNKNNMKEKLWVDMFYGIPLKQLVYDSYGREIEKHTFTHLIVDISEEEVLLPDSYTISH